MHLQFWFSIVDEVFSSWFKSYFLEWVRFVFVLPCYNFFPRYSSCKYEKMYADKVVLMRGWNFRLVQGAAVESLLPVSMS